MADSSAIQPIALPPGDFAGYIFDCDGTLAASMAIHHQSWNYAIQQQVPTFTLSWEDLCAMGGMSIRETVEALHQRYGITLDPEKILPDYDADLDRRIDSVQPCEDVLAAARALARAGKPVAVASGGFRRYVDRTLKAIGAKEIFPVIVTIEDVARAKPAPDLFLLAAEKMGVPPERCLVVEDSPKGEEAATAAGMQCLLVPPH